MGELFDDVIEVITAQNLIDQGCLAKFDYYAPSLDLDLTDVRRKAGDYVAADLEEKLNRSVIYGDVLNEYEKLAKNKKTIVYCATVEHSRATAAAFRSYGYNAIHFDGTTSRRERDRIVDEFRAGEIQILCNCDLISFGFDVPDCDCCVLLRPTQSLALYIQQAMRCLRGMPGKRALILDFVGNYQRHGLPTQERVWSLSGRVKRHQEFDEEGNLLVRTCEYCYGTFSASHNVCPYCGRPYSLTPREIKQIKAVALEKITVAKAKQKERLTKEILQLRNSLAECKSSNEIYAYCKAKGWKPGAGYWEMKRRGWVK